MSNDLKKFLAALKEVAPEALMTTTIEEVRALMSEYPLLNAHGHGKPRAGGPFPDAARAEMLTASFLREVDAARTWLQGAVKTKNISRVGSSYYLKHRVEETVGRYVSNGGFIVAALLEGFTMEKNEFNPCFNIAQRRVDGTLLTEVSTRRRYKGIL